MDDSQPRQRPISSAFYLPMVISLGVTISASLAVIVYHLILVKYCTNGSRQRRGTSFSSALGVDKHVLDSIPVICYSSNEFKADECIICLGEFEDGEEVRKLHKCEHVFHLTCIDAWFIGHKDCPLCREAVDSVAPEHTTCTERESDQIASQSLEHDHHERDNEGDRISSWSLEQIHDHRNGSISEIELDGISSQGQDQSPYNNDGNNDDTGASSSSFRSSALRQHRRSFVKTSRDEEGTPKLRRSLSMPNLTCVIDVHGDSDCFVNQSGPLVPSREGKERENSTESERSLPIDRSSVVIDIQEDRNESRKPKGRSDIRLRSRSLVSYLPSLNPSSWLRNGSFGSGRNRVIIPITSPN